MNKKMDMIKIRSNKVLFVFIFFLFVVFILRLVYLCTVNYKVGNITIRDFIKSRNIKEEVLLPDRGSIYDSKGNILAQDVASYTVIAYLSASRSENSDKLEHVVDKEKTATLLAPLINMSYDDVFNLLNKKGVYQVELGPGGRNLSQLEMENIKKLELPGIDFIRSTKRYYPNGDFASYTLGYTVKKTDSSNNEWIVGEMGIEGYYDDYLKGSVGYVTYEKDKNGYKIPNGRQYREDAKNGNDIYLTIDSNIQLFVENAVREASSLGEDEWFLMLVADAKTGAILGSASTPSFDPNIRNMTSYLNPFVSYAYEPGSTMKTYTYMCAIEKGTYNGNMTFVSGSKEYVDKTDKKRTMTIRDWNKKGWGTITYDYGYAMSSNIGIANILENFITKDELRACLSKYGFGKKTMFTMDNEYTGNIDFTYDIEAATAGYGQGITTTPMQHIQALTSIANYGDMLKPYIVSKIVDKNTGKTIYSASREVVNTVSSVSTIEKIKDLMKSVVCEDKSKCTGGSYYMDGYDVIGKTGTAEIFDYKLGKYTSDAIYSFAGMFPYEDPEIIIYAASKKATSSIYLTNAVKNVIVNVSKYLDISVKNNNDGKSYYIDNYINKDINYVSKSIDKDNLDVVVIGTGDKIIGQYPKEGTSLNKGDKVFLLTSVYTKVMPNVIGYSYKDVSNLLDLMDISYVLDGYGYVYEQSIEHGVELGLGEVVNIKLKGKYD